MKKLVTVLLTLIFSLSLLSSSSLALNKTDIMVAVKIAQAFVEESFALGSKQLASKIIDPKSKNFKAYLEARQKYLKENPSKDKEDKYKDFRVEVLDKVIQVNLAYQETNYSVILSKETDWQILFATSNDEISKKFEQSQQDIDLGYKQINKGIETNILKYKEAELKEAIYQFKYKLKLDKTSPEKTKPEKKNTSEVEEIAKSFIQDSFNGKKESKILANDNFASYLKNRQKLNPEKKESKLKVIKTIDHSKNISRIILENQDKINYQVLIQKDKLKVIFASSTDKLSQFFEIAPASPKAKLGFLFAEQKDQEIKLTDAEIKDEITKIQYRDPKYYQDELKEADYLKAFFEENAISLAHSYIQESFSIIADSADYSFFISKEFQERAKKRAESIKESQALSKKPQFKIKRIELKRFGDLQIEVRSTIEESYLFNEQESKQVHRYKVLIALENDQYKINSASADDPYTYKLNRSKDPEKRGAVEIQTMKIFDQSLKINRDKVKTEELDYSKINQNTAEAIVQVLAKNSILNALEKEETNKDTEKDNKEETQVSKDNKYYNMISKVKIEKSDLIIYNDNQYGIITGIEDDIRFSNYSYHNVPISLLTDNFKIIKIG